MSKHVIVFMVAGVSSRYNNKIKQLVPVGPQGETLIEYSIDQALSVGFEEVVFIVGKNTEKAFKDKFGYVLPSGHKVSYVLQKYDEKVRKKPWGTADALCCIKDVVDCPFVICNGDDIYGKETFKLLSSHLDQSDEAAAIGYPLKNVLSNKGAVNRALYDIENGYVKKIVEVFNITKTNSKELNGDNLCSMNIYALHPGTVTKLCLHIENYKKDHFTDTETEFLIQHELTKLIESGDIKMRIYPTDDEWFGITNPGDEIEIQKRLKSRKINNKE